MRKEIIQTGKTVEEAIQTGCMLLGVDQQDCDIVIIDLPKSSFFGLKKTPAKVKISIEVASEDLLEEELYTKETTKEVPEHKEKKPEQELPPKKEAEKQVVTHEKSEAVEKPKVEKPEVKEEPRKDFIEKTLVTKSVPVAEAGLSQLDEEKVQIAVEYVTLIAKSTDVNHTIETRYEDDTVIISIYGKSLGVLIGRRGETLNAIQYLTGLVANRLDGDYLRISVDVGDYRKKRNISLREMAVKAAEDVLRTNVSVILESMNPAERRIVHSVVAEISGVSSASTGYEPHRRVVVKTPTSKAPRSGGTKARRSGGKPPERERKSNQSSGESRRQAEPQPQKTSSQPIVTPETKGTTPLYGKVDLD